MSRSVKLTLGLIAVAGLVFAGFVIFLDPKEDQTASVGGHGNRDGATCPKRTARGFQKVARPSSWSTSTSNAKPVYPCIPRSKRFVPSTATG